MIFLAASLLSMQLLVLYYCHTAPSPGRPPFISRRGDVLGEEHGSSVCRRRLFMDCSLTSTQSGGFVISHIRMSSVLCPQQTAIRETTALGKVKSSQKSQVPKCWFVMSAPIFSRSVCRKSSLRRNSRGRVECAQRQFCVGACRSVGVV